MSGRRWRDGSCIAVIGMALVVGACSGPPDVSVAPPADEPDGITVPAVTSTSSTASDGTEAVTPLEEDLASLEVTWAAIWEAVGRASVDGAAALDDITDLVSPEALDALAEPFGSDGKEHDPVTSPAITMNDDGVTINDCVLVWPPGLTGMAYWFEATASLDGTGGTDGTESADGTGSWVVETIEVRSQTGCVPADIADGILGDYDEFWEARAEYWDPPDPDHPDVDGTMTGDELDRIRGLLTQHQADGWHAVNTVGATHPEIIRVVQPWQVVVLDCQLAAPERGLFDGEGRRQEGLSEPEPEQRDHYEVTLVLEDRQWKVSNVQVEEESGCDFAPTPLGLPIV